jgi:hypothetical protein
VGNGVLSAGPFTAALLSKECDLMMLTPEQISSFQSLFLGFAFAGLLASVFEVTTHRRVSFALLESRSGVNFTALPLVVFAAPHIIMRNTIRGRRLEKRHFVFVVMATIIASLWSMACGHVVLEAAQLLI